jgi:hypothetical protein
VQGAEVAATVTDANGANIVDGTEVTFSISVLGTAAPSIATTSAGVAKSVITPLSTAGTGVPVVVTAGEIQSSVLVSCSTAQGGGGSGTPPTGNGGGGPGGVISGPDTGSGGYADGESLQVWPALALGLAALGLAAVRLAVYRLR